MFKVYVIIFGLVAVVPAADNKSVTAILLNTAGLTYSSQLVKQAKLASPKAAPHQATAKLRRPGTSNIVFDFAGEDLVVTPSGPQGAAALDLSARDRFPQIATLVGAQAASVMPGCISGDGSQCRAPGVPTSLVHGRVKLNGGWKLKAANVESGVLKPQDASTFTFVGVGDNKEIPAPALANAFQFEIEVANAGAVSALNGAEQLPLTAASSDECRALDPNAPNCAIMTVGNVPNCVTTMTMSRFDVDFELLYDLLATPAANPAPLKRFVPFQKTVVVEKPGNPPGSKCFGGLVLPPPPA